MPDNCIHCCITSPPYFGLRDYGTGTWEGGDPTCDHIIGEIRTGLGMAALGKLYRGGGHKASQPKPLMATGKCPKCAARRIDQQIGLEDTPWHYVDRLVAVFREVRRVLRKDGVCFLNIGDSYASSGGAGGQGKRGCRFDRRHTQETLLAFCQWPAAGMKAKDLLLLPFRLAIALQADGWWVRSILPWVKANIMPESTGDRPTTAVEYVLMVTKSARYFWDAQAVKRRGAIAAGTRAAKGSAGRADLAGVNGRPAEYWEYTGERNFRNSDLFFSSLAGPRGLITDRDGTPLALEVNPHPFLGAHFATFPPGLVEPLLAAATSAHGVCAECGAPWRRVVRKGLQPTPKAVKRAVVDDRDLGADANDQGSNRQKDGHRSGYVRADATVGWKPTCEHVDASVVPAQVLDPFAGAGTVALVAERMQRGSMSVDLKADYVIMAVDRVLADSPLLAAAV